VSLDLRFLTRQELAAHVNRARAVAYLPWDEDSVGYVTMEAFQACKPVLTATDAGGLLQIVHDGETGRVVEPEPEALAAAMADLLDDPARSAARGRAGHALWTSLKVDWPSTVDKLLA
jgi:glycosyltransferase involved in cell wall biosynthesis